MYTTQINDHKNDNALYFDYVDKAIYTSFFGDCKYLVTAKAKVLLYNTNTELNVIVLPHHFTMILKPLSKHHVQF